MAPAVRVNDQQGAAMAGVAVTFTVAAGGGAVSAATVTTNAQGEASTSWKLGTAAGTQRLTASVSGISTPVTFTAIATPGPVRSVGIISGDGQEALPGQPLPQPVRVVARDQYGNPTPDRLLTWQVQGGGFASPSGPTNAQGEATATWTLGTTGEQRLVVSAEGVADSVASVSATLLGLITGTVALSNGYWSPVALAAAMGEVMGRSDRKQGLGGPAGDDVIPGEFIVHLNPGPLGAPAVGSAALRTSRVAAAVGAAMRAALAPHAAAGEVVVAGVSPVLLAARVVVANGRDPATVAASLRADPAVALVEPSRRVHRNARRLRTALPTMPSDPAYYRQAWHYQQIGLLDAWRRTTGVSSVIVAVVDDGIRFDHPDLAGALTQDGYDFVSSLTGVLCGTFAPVDLTGDGGGYDPDPTIPADWETSSTDCLLRLSTEGAHGTHVAGTIAARSGNGVGGVGVAPGVRIRPIRVLDIIGSGRSYDVAQGILYAAGLPADNGLGGTVVAPSRAPIINLSLSGSHTLALQSAVIAATAAGSLVVAAAGNDGTSTPEYPAAYPEVLSVAALDAEDNDAPYSNFGSTIDIAAPGGRISQGVDHGVYSTAWNFAANTPVYGSWQGTSMAAPHVSGVAALVLSAEPGLSATQLRSRLLSTARDVDLPGPDIFTGAGAVDAAGALGLWANPRRTVMAANAATQVFRAPVTLTGSAFSVPVPAGTWRLYAAEQFEGDQGVATPARRWSAAGGTGRPTAIAVTPGAVLNVPLALGFPIEAEPNDTPALANPLPLGGYLVGRIAPAQADLYRLSVASAGPVTIETFGFNYGACGWAISANPRVTILADDAATVLGAADDAGPTDLCARLTLNLQPGGYYVLIEAGPMVFGSLASRWYMVQARSGT
ncbi:MAG: S8 family serine peptidase [Gemmatimonadota bacterium]